MSVFDNIASIFSGNSPFQQRNAIEQLANDPAFQQMSPAQQQMKIAGVTGNPQDALSAINRQAAQNLPTNDTGAMVRTATNSGLLPVEGALTALANPNLQVGAVNNVQPAGNTSQQQTSTGAPQSQASPQRTGVDTNYLSSIKKISPAVGTMAENMISGVFSPESGKGENDPVYNNALAVARRADPTFTPQSLIGRPAMVKNATSGKMYSDATNMNAVIGHLYDLNESIPALGDQEDNGTWVNKPINQATAGLGTAGNKGLQQFKQVRDLSTEELAKFYGGGTSSDASRKTASDAFDENQQPSVLKNNLQKTLGMVASRANANQMEYDQTMGAAGTAKIIQPRTQALVKDLQGKPLSPQEQQLVDQHRAESGLPPKYTIPQSQTTQANTQPSLAELMAEKQRRAKK